MSAALSWPAQVFGADWTELTAAHLAGAVSAGVRRPDLVWRDHSQADWNRRDATE